MDLTILPSLKAYLVYETDEESHNYGEFREVKQIGFIRFGSSLTHLPNLKYASGSFEEDDDPQEVCDIKYSYTYYQ